MNTIQHTLNQEAESPKIYNRKSIRLATLLGGPLVAGYLIAENYKAFNEFRLAKRTWTITGIVAVVFYFVVCSVSAANKIAVVIVPIVFSWFTAYLVQHFQGDMIEDHFDTGGEEFSIWRAVAISSIGLLIMLTPIFLMLTTVTPHYMDIK